MPITHSRRSFFAALAALLFVPFARKLSEEEYDRRFRHMVTDEILKMVEADRMPVIVAQKLRPPLKFRINGIEYHNMEAVAQLRKRGITADWLVRILKRACGSDYKPEGDKQIAAMRAWGL